MADSDSDMLPELIRSSDESEEEVEELLGTNNGSCTQAYQRQAIIV